MKEKINNLYNDFELFRLNHTQQGKPESLYAAMQYIMDLGGKRARPLLVLSSCLSAGGDTVSALPIALAVEEFHNFSLIHDDIMDKADLRRGATPVHKNWNESTAILAGDNLLVSVFEKVMSLQLPKRDEIMKLLIQTAREVCEGQQFDMDFETKTTVSESEYLEMIRLKTAVLLGCSSACGALAANADSERTFLYYQYAVSLGMSFQLQDDYLDLFGDAAKTGKAIGGDIAERKKNWFFVASTAIGTDIFKIYEIEDEKVRIQKALDLYASQDLKSKCNDLKAKFEQTAMDVLGVLSSLGEDVQWIKSVADYLKARDH